MTMISAEQTPRKVGGFFNRIGASISTKLMFALLVLTLVPVILITIFGNISQHNALKIRTFDSLESIRILKGQSIVTYMKSVRSPAINFSASPPSINAAKQIKLLFTELNKPEFADAANVQRAELENYYLNVFAPDFETQNPGQQLPQDMVADLDQAAVLMQSRFLLGNADAFNGLDPQIQTQYEQVYAAINGFAQGVQKTWAFSNMFIIDPDSGRILYSVANNIDLATSLKDPTFSDSALGEIFRQSLTLSEPREFLYSDVSQHIPTYFNPEFYISSPIFADGERVGILILATPIEKLSTLLLAGKSLGETGQTYLVGTDYLWRNDSPFLNEMEMDTTV